jgi:hypothetical protein
VSSPLPPGVAAGIAHMGALVDRTCGFGPRVIVNLSVGADLETTTALCNRIECSTIECAADSVTRLKAAGIDAVQCDITDMSALKATFGDLGEVEGLLLFDVLQDLPQPQRFLAALSAWSVDHNSPRLFISVPNVAHFDRGVGLLLGNWVLGSSTSGGTPSNFTGTTLERTLQQCGWLRLDEESVLAVRSEEWDEETFNAIPEEMVGALRVLSEAYNPYSDVERFVWVLEPTRFDKSLESIGAALGEDSIATRNRYSEERRERVQQYLNSLGLVVSETERRALVLRSMPPPLWKRSVLKWISASPRLSSKIAQVKRRLG